MDPAHSRGNRRSVLWLALGLLAAGALLLWIYRSRVASFRWGVFAQGFQQVDPAWLSVAIVLILLTYVGRALRWRVMMRPICPNPNFRRLTVATTVGFTAVVLLGRPGEFVRPYLIARSEGVSVSSQLAIWILERIYDLLIVLLLFGLGLTQVNPSADLHPALQWLLRTGGWLVGGLATLCVLILLALNRFGEAFQRRLMESLTFLPAARLKQVEEILTAFVGGMQSTRKGNFVLLILVYSFLEWGTILGTIYCLLRGFPATAGFSWLDAVVYLGFVSFGSAVQVPGIGGGMQVASVLVLTEFFGLGLEPAGTISVLIWLVTWVAIVPLGLLLALVEGLSWKQLKNIQPDAAP